MSEINNDEFDIREKCIEKCLSFFKSVPETGEIKFEKVVGKSETYYKSIIEYRGHTIEIYIYNDGAELEVDNDYNPRFEWYDGITEDELIDSFISALETTINKLK